jgi:hypothetical protein
LRLQQFSGRQRVVSQKTPKKLNTYVEKPTFPTIFAHRHPPFLNLVFNSTTHHPGLAGIAKKRELKNGSGFGPA